MKRASRHFVLSLLLVAACGRSQLDPTYLDYDTVVGSGGARNRAGAPGNVTAGRSSTGGTFSQAGTPAIVGGFGTSGTPTTGGILGMGGSPAVAGTFGVAGFPVAGSFAEGGEPSVVVNVVQVTAGLFHVCMLSQGGSVKCWGAGDQGALGYGDTAAIGDNEKLSALPSLQVASDPAVHALQIVAGGYHTCALLEGGAVKCWGKNSDGQLGYGDVAAGRGSATTAADNGVVQVSSDPNAVVQSLCAGEKHTCALLDDGSVKCWGSNESGQLGYGNGDLVGAKLKPAEVDPVPVTTLPNVRVTQLACGGAHTCAVLSNGTAKCWGDDGFGELGLGFTQNVGDDETPASHEPISLSQDASVKALEIAVGAQHACARLSDATVRCWGRGENLGLARGTAGANVGDDELPSSAAPLALAQNPQADVPAALSIGSRHSCVRFASGNLKCWGENDFGELGQGNLDLIGVDDKPADHGNILVDNAATGEQVGPFVAGNFLSCAAVKPPMNNDATDLYCWGWNEYGQLGRGDTFTLGDNELPTAQGPLRLY